MVELLIAIAFFGLVYLYYINFEKPKGRGGPPPGGLGAA